jgi:hypothetical protein
LPLPVIQVHNRPTPVTGVSEMPSA